MTASLDAALLRKIFLRLLRSPSPSRQEHAVAQIAGKFATELGYKVKEDDAGKKLGGDCGNLIITVPATDKKLPSLLLSAHLDTVGAAVAPKIIHDEKTDRYHTDGATILGADDKCGVAILLALLHRLADKKTKVPHGELLIVLSVAEEVGAAGAEAVNEKVYAKYAGGIVLDSPSPTKITVGAPTKVDINVAIHGVGGHAAYPDDHINAAQVLARAVGRLPNGRLDESSTANLGIAWAGTAVNVIPDAAYAEYEIRSHNDNLLDFHLANALSIIESAVREARSAHQPENGAHPIFSKATVDVDIITQFCSFHLPDDSLPVRLLSKAGADAGFAMSKVIDQGGSDANTYNSRGLPTAVLGCGMHDYHGVGEYADFKEMLTCGEIIFRAVQGLQ